jgi:hypothetical protein
MMAKRVRLRPGTNNQHVARVHAEFKAAIEQEAVNEAPQAEGNGHQPHRDQHHAA